MPAARSSVRLLAAGFLSVLVCAAAASAQELEPRAYSPSPTGTTFLGVAATRSAGGVFTDPSAQLTDVEADIGILTLAVGHSFALLGRSSLVLGLVPIAWGHAQGEVGEAWREANRRGLADPRIRLSVILSGFKPMTTAEFARTPLRSRIFGASLTVVPPMGQYQPSKLINLGSHRWSLKPEVGLSVPAGRWTVEGYLGVWFFTENHVYYPGDAQRAQDPIAAIQGHISYSLGRRGWLAVNGTWYSGGQVTVNGADSGAPYRNARLGATWAIPVGRRHSFKVAYSAGAATRIGADFRTLTAAWQLVLY
jgi:hypothetical protein